MNIALTGASGHMGKEALKQFLTLNPLDKIRILVLEEKEVPKMRKEFKNHLDKLEILQGDLADLSICRSLVKDMDYVFNLAALIPSGSDKDPLASKRANHLGVLNLIQAIEELSDKQPKFVDITSVALYGDRNYKHPFGRVSDPLLPSPYDVYSIDKMRGEFAVLESNIKNWVVIRQTAMIYLDMIDCNHKDGLMFHTTFNGPLEWSTAEQSGLLMKNIVIEDQRKDLSKIFWRKVFNLGSGEENRITGYETLDLGFQLMGGSASSFFGPRDNIGRNFHGVWFYDGKELDKLFHFQGDKIHDYFKKIGKAHKIYRAGKILPPGLIRKFVLDPLKKDDLAPAYWAKHNIESKLIAYFGSREAYEKLPHKFDDTYPLLCQGNLPNGEHVDYASLKKEENARFIDYGFDVDKKDEEINLEDLQRVAAMHGGKLLETKFMTGDIYRKLKWENQDGEVFEARPYTVLRGGHFMNISYKNYAWDFDRLCQKDKIYAQYWYDSHEKNENHYYYMDEQYHALIK